MKIALLAFALAGCALSKDRLEFSRVYGRLNSDGIGEAMIVNSSSGEHMLKDNFVIWAVDGQEVIHGARPLDISTAVASGRHYIQLRFRGYRGLFQSNTVQAIVTVEANIFPQARYEVCGEVAGTSAVLWLKDIESGIEITDRNTGSIKNYSDFDPVPQRH